MSAGPVVEPEDGWRVAVDARKGIEVMCRECGCWWVWHGEDFVEVAQGYRWMEQHREVCKPAAVFAVAVAPDQGVLF